MNFSLTLWPGGREPGQADIRICRDECLSTESSLTWWRKTMSGNG